METCSNCGAIARPGAKFCTTCGSRLSPTEAPASVPGWQQPAASDSADTVVAPAVNASESDEPSASNGADTSANVSSAEAQDGPPPAPSSWTWGASDSTTSSEAVDSEATPPDSDAAESVESTATAAAPSSWSWNSGAQGADDTDHDEAATIDATEQANQDADSDLKAETETSADGGVTSSLASVSSSADDSSTDTATTSTWSWGESHSEADRDASSASEVESSPAASDVTGTNTEDVSALATSSPDVAVDQELSTADAGSTVESESKSESVGDSSSSDVDVSSAFAEDTQAEGEGGGEETLSSWAARWNETESDDTEAAAASADISSADAADATATDLSESSTIASESEPAKIVSDSAIDFTEQSPLEGAPGGQQPSYLDAHGTEDTDATGNESTGNMDAEADTLGFGIEGAPGGLLPEDHASANAENEGEVGDSLDASDTSGTEVDPDVSVLPAYRSEHANADQTSPTSETDAGTDGDHYDSASNAASDDLTAELPHDEEVGEPSGAHGGEVTPGTDSDLVNPLVGMDVSPTHVTTSTNQDAGDTGAPSTESARNRAEQLIDELRDLLPSLAASGSEATVSTAGTVEGSGADQNLQPVIDELAAARPQTGSFDDLRAALEKARTNPRDVDTMLDLVGRVDDLIALLDSQDRLNTAAGHAVDQLRQAGSHPEG